MRARRHVESWLATFDTAFGGPRALGSSAAGGEIATARAAAALARGAPQRALDALSTTAFAHYAHGPRPHLIGIWTDAQIAIEEAAKGRPLTAIERKHVKYDPKRAPPKAVGALNMPKAMAPPGAHWP